LGEISIIKSDPIPSFLPIYRERYGTEYYGRAEDGGKFEEIEAICRGGQSGCGHTFDLTVGSKNAIKFDTSTLHIRFYANPQGGRIEYHWDVYNIRTDFIKHFWVDVLHF